MVTEKQFRDYVRRMDTVSRSTKAAIRRMWPKLDQSSPDALRDSLLRYMPSLVDKLGKVAALVSAEFYEAAMPEGSEYVVITAGGGKLSTVERDIKWAVRSEPLVKHLADGNAEPLISFMEGTADRVVKSYGRETMQENVESDDRCSGYASIPSEDCGCAFCLMKSTDEYRKYAGDTLSSTITSDAWHDNCNCQLLPSFGGMPKWANDAIGKAREAYGAGIDLLDENGIESPKLSDVMAAMRNASDGALTH